MRKIYMTFVLTLLVAFVSAQSLQTGPELNVQRATKSGLLKLVNAKTHNATKGADSRWYDYASSIDAQLGNIGDMNFTYLFPDTNCLMSYGTSFDPPWVHAIATIIDPKSAWFEENGALLINDTIPYTLDSAVIYCGYYRNTASTVVDTLRFEFFTSNNHTEVPSYYFTAQFVQDNYSVDTLFFKGIKRVGLDLDIPSKVVFDYLLHEADTATTNGWNIFQAGPATPINVAANEVAGVAIRFIPGFTYSATDTITSMGNYIVFASMEENGDNTYPNYTKRDWNTSQIVPSWATETGSNWETVYVPEWAFVQAYGFENHLIMMKYSVTDAIYSGIEKAENNSLSVSQNRPNPFSGSTTVNYQLDKSANVSLDVYNVAGAKVMSINQGVQSAGSHSIQIDASELQAGIYYYTITADAHSVTKKMVVY